MKLKTWCLFILLFLGLGLPSITLAQPGIAFYRSSSSSIGFNYELNKKFRPEVRLGIDDGFDRNYFSFNVNYNFSRTEERDVYVGLGFIDQGNRTGLAIPLGINIYPFTAKQFGFHFELNLLAFQQDDTIIQGNWGIRYRFFKT